MVEEPESTVRIAAGLIGLSKTLDFGLSSAERAQYFLENPEPPVHSPSPTAR